MSVKQCKIIGMITIELGTDPSQEDIDRIAEYRRDALLNFLKRHIVDIENEMAWCDSVNIDVRMEYSEVKP